MIIETGDFSLTDEFDNDDIWSAICQVTLKIKKVYYKGNEVENIDELPKSMHDFIKENALKSYIIKRAIMERKEDTCH
tara:strand:+ start:22 stop:255 length:234 start_codon:yes stop_codon:yes gene_type:complete